MIWHIRVMMPAKIEAITIVRTSRLMMWLSSWPSTASSSASSSAPRMPRVTVTLRDDRALEILKAAPPDVMNHNLETVPRLYKEARPGSDYRFSLNLLKKFKALHPNVPTKSGLMVGLGETDEEILAVMRDMRGR